MSNQFTPNLERIIELPKTPAVVKEVARHVQKDGYLLPGTFLKGLSDVDLDVLVGFCETMHVGSVAPPSTKELAYETMIMLTTLLTLGEGKTGQTREELLEDLVTTVTFVTLEKLARRNLVEFDREAASYIDDNVIAKLKEA